VIHLRWHGVGRSSESVESLASSTRNPRTVHGHRSRGGEVARVGARLCGTVGANVGGRHAIPRAIGRAEAAARRRRETRGNKPSQRVRRYPAQMPAGPPTVLSTTGRSDDRGRGARQDEQPCDDGGPRSAWAPDQPIKAVVLLARNPYNVARGSARSRSAPDPHTHRRARTDRVDASTSPSSRDTSRARARQRRIPGAGVASRFRFRSAKSVRYRRRAVRGKVGRT